MKNSILFVLAILTFGVCSAAKPIKTKNSEAVIFGRFTLDTKSEINREKIELHFLIAPKGTAKIKIDSDGFFCMKIQTGNSITDYVKYSDGGDFRKILTDHCLNLYLPEAGKVYYVGDIIMKWTPTDRDKIKKGFSIGIGMGTYNVGGGVSVPISDSYTPDLDCPEITIKERSASIEQFQQLYPEDNREVVTQFMDLEGAREIQE